MKLYTRDTNEAHALAAKVDSIFPDERWSNSNAKRNLHKYTEYGSFLSGNKSAIECDTRREIVRYFVSEMEGRAQKEVEAGRGHDPFDAPVVEIGYTLYAHQRLQSHREHSSSNYIMNLAEAVFALLYPKLFPLQQAVIYACFTPEQPWIGEIFFTQLAQGYTQGGRGFSHEPAGRSNWSGIRKVGVELWNTYFEAACEKGRLEERVKKGRAEAEKELESLNASVKRDEQRMKIQEKKLALLQRLAELAKEEVELTRAERQGQGGTGGPSGSL